MPSGHLTIGDVARIASVADRTASKWCDEGLLPHHRIPGSQDRRVRPKDLTAFLRGQGLPVPPALLSHPPTGEVEIGGRECPDAFAAGVFAFCGVRSFVAPPGALSPKSRAAMAALRIKVAPPPPRERTR